jgi:hypothetical protein
MTFELLVMTWDRHMYISSVLKYETVNNMIIMISLWKGKSPIYFGVIRSKVKVTYYKLKN